ncbi:hypothetical protein M231_05159, partial [Tremella mesenterica]
GHVRFGAKVLISPGSHILDCCPVTIGTRTMIGANATIMSGGHSVFPSNRWPESTSLLDPTADGAPIYIGSDCWFGANVTVLQGVRIGDGCTIGAGSVVVKDIPDRCVAVGNPCRVIKRLDDIPAESMEEYIERFKNGDNGGKMKWAHDGQGGTKWLRE